MLVTTRSLAVLATMLCLAPRAVPPPGSPQATANTSWLSLPEVVEPAALRAGLLDQPEIYCILDVRPEWQFQEFHVPHAVHATADTLLDTIRAQRSDARIVIVDRDGTQAFAVAGAAHVALGEATRPLRVLAGGTARYWREVVLPTRASGTTANPATTPSAAPGATSPAAPASPAPVKPRSAGC